MWNVCGYAVGRGGTFSLPRVDNGVGVVENGVAVIENGM
jgi:hypothetical protein